MDNHNLNMITREHFLKMECFYIEGTEFDNIIIVPTDHLNCFWSSGFRDMRFILFDSRIGKIVGVIDSDCDVINPNGIGNYGSDLGNIREHRIPYMGLSMDCLDRSQCVRIMMGRPCVVHLPVLSSFEFYCKYDEEKE